MRLFLESEEVEIDPEVEIRDLGDRLIVKTPDGAYTALAVRSGDRILVSFRGRQYALETALRRTGSHSVAASGEIRSPMPGQIVEVLVTQGAPVRLGQKILVMEAMKTQQPFVAPFDGVVASLSATKGAQVSEGDLLAEIHPAEESP